MRRANNLLKLGDELSDCIERLKRLRSNNPTQGGQMLGDVHEAVVALERAQGQVDAELGTAYRQERTRDVAA